MTRWKLAILSALALVPLWVFDSRDRVMVLGTTAFSILMLVTPRAIVQRKSFVITALVLVLVVLPIVSTSASGQWNELPFALILAGLMGALICWVAVKWRPTS